MTIKKTAGKWDPKRWPMYFSASNMGTFIDVPNIIEDLLLAINDLKPTDMKTVKEWLDLDKNILIDSGVYNLSTQHANKHKVSMDVALSLAPDKIDGFEDLFAAYTDIVSDIGDKAWGYIEIDQGGRENKIKTRAKLEKMGFAPIPVYHPINDGWDYFDYLAERYDRICLGNIVMADQHTRLRLIATAWERRRRYPHLWIHALGMTPSHITNAFPMNSCDSSTWISSLRWGSHKTTAALVAQSDLSIEFIYDRTVDVHAPRGHRQSLKMCAFDSVIIGRTMRQFAADQKKYLGADIGLFIKEAQ